MPKASKDSEFQSTTARHLVTGQLSWTPSGHLSVDEAVVNEDASPRSVPSQINGSENIDFLRDDPSEMTLGRRIALALMDKKWYNPQAGQEDGSETKTKGTYEDFVLDPEKIADDDADLLTQKATPSLQKAWAYFEHVALERYIIEDKEPTQRNRCQRIIRRFQKGDKKMERAEPGATTVKTKLYPPIFTPHAQLGDFGLGIGLYFSTLRAFMITTVVLGFISLYNMQYYASDDYMPAFLRNNTTNALIQGSAVCLNTPWVPCPNCTCTSIYDDGRRPDFDELLSSRCGRIEGTNLTVALKNDCNVLFRQLGAVNYATVVLFLLATILLGFYFEQQEIKFDEDEQTAQDYALRVKNPPHDAVDPEEWRNFFFQSCEAQVTVCTIAVDNDILVRTLVERREVLRTIQNNLDPGVSMSNLKLAYIAAKTERERTWLGRFLAPFLPGLPEFYARYVALNAKVQGLAQLDFPATNVFLIFETEEDQRKVLENLSVGTLKAARNDAKALKDPKYLFRGKHVLAVEEPDEPSTIRWRDLNAGFLQKVKEQALTAFATLCAIVLVAFIVRVASDVRPIWAAVTISVFNSAFPIFAKMLTDLEAHAAEGEKQTSLYFKIALFRWVNTAIVITIITPFTSTLAENNGLIPQIYALFFSEIVTVTAYQLADPMGHINRHILAPRAANQDDMNLKFSGQPFELAERYTDMTKLLFLCVWYCSIFPGAFFLCGLALFIKYFVDRFSLMRTWKRPPQLGTRVSKFSRRYFFSLAGVAMAIMSSSFWSGFPFDNLCELEEPLEGYNYSLGSVVQAANSASRMNGMPLSITDTHYRVCNQNLMAPGRGRTFPFVASRQPEGDEWMTPEQEDVTTIFGWSAVAITILVIIKFVWGWIEVAMTFFHSSYSSVGDDQNIPFSQVTSRCAYIPQVYSSMFSYPLIACDTSKVDERLYDWGDPDRPYVLYDLTVDAKHILHRMDVPPNVGFSKVQHWTPKYKKGLASH